MTTKTMDQRSTPRVRVRELRLELPDGHRFVQGNVSMGGIGFETDECLPIAVGDRLRVSFSIAEEDDLLDFNVEIRHIRLPDRGERFYVGAAFDEIDIMVRNPLFRFVEESLLEAIWPSRGLSPFRPEGVAQSA